MTSSTGYRADPRWTAARDEWVADKPADEAAAAHFIRSLFCIGRMYRIEAAYEQLDRVPTDEEVASIPEPDIDLSADEGARPR
jgi:DNA-binding SARP family transcriptional activator